VVTADGFALLSLRSFAIRALLFLGLTLGASSFYALPYLAIDAQPALVDTPVPTN
jgi:hypothetical protein